MKTHGKRHTRAYSIWWNMRNRCERETNDNYAYYGGRGIKVCERWKSFENFHADMGDPPEGMTLDRKDSNKDYEPGNCRWATPLEQSSNTRSALKLVHDNICDTLNGWSRRTGIKAPTLCKRLKSGKTLAEAIAMGVPA